MSPFVESADGVRLHVEIHDGVHGKLHGEFQGDIHGEHHPVLLVHGFTGSVEAWGDGPIRGLSEAGCRVLAVDLPGHGRSDVPDDSERYALPRVVDDLCAVLDAEGIGAADWIGYSMGGRVALGAAALRPDRVRHLVLESASPGLADPAEARTRRKADAELARSILDDGIEAFVDRWMAHPLFASQQRLPAEQLARERARRLRCDPRGLANTLFGLGTGSQPSFWDALPDIAQPTLLLTGQLDEKFCEIADRMAERLPDARRATVPGAGHTVHLEAPSEWLERALALVSGREVGGG